MKYDFDEQIDRRNTNSAKFDEMDALFGSDVMHLGVADMDYRSPKPIIEAMQNIVEKGVFGYTIWPENYEELVSQWMKRRYGQETKNEWVVFSPRINMALNMAVETFTNEGDGIVLHTPAYTALQNAVEKYHRVMIESPLVLENGRYKMDFQQLRRNLDEKKAQGVCVYEQESDQVTQVENGYSYCCEMADKWRNHYKDFLKKLRGVYPEAWIVCCTTVLQHDKSWDDAIDRVVDSMKDEKISHFLFSRNGVATPGHPRIPEQFEMAREMADYIENVLGVYKNK